MSATVETGGDDTSCEIWPPSDKPETMVQAKRCGYNPVVACRGERTWAGENGESQRGKRSNGANTRLDCLLGKAIAPH